MESERRMEFERVGYQLVVIGILFGRVGNFNGKCLR